MNKLPPQEKFLDFSDYSRPFSRLLVKKIKDTKISSLTFTTLSFVCGTIAAVLIYINHFRFLIFLLILLKSFFDAVDGELARARNRPSYVGRFYDSVVDFFVNLFIFIAIYLRFNEPLIKLIAVIILFHLQGSVYNYYYVLKRHKTGGDKTSQIDEKKITSIYPYDNPFWFKIFHKLYIWIYSWQDEIIHRLDRKAEQLINISNTFMTIVSLLGLGTQLLIIAVLVLLKFENFIIDFFTYYYTIVAIGIILIRKYMFDKE